MLPLSHTPALEICVSIMHPLKYYATYIKPDVVDALYIIHIVLLVKNG